MTALALLTISCTASSTDGPEQLNALEWRDVVARAHGQTLNLFMWGGSSEINRFVDDFYTGRLRDEYGIALNRIPIADTVDAVTKVLGELEAGRRTGGSVDLIWINGENFATLRQTGALLEGWSDGIPNARYVDWDSPGPAFDFGLSVDGAESPWGSAQFQFVYDSSRLSADEVPRSYRELLDWARESPGRFTYPAPPAFHGTRFVKQAFYELTGDVGAWSGDFDQDAYDAAVGPVFGYLQELDRFLWREGETYPSDLATTDSLFANGEIDFSFSQLPAGIQPKIQAGILPSSARPFVFDSGTIGDFHFLAIPVNAGHAEAAMIFANLVLEPELQAAKLDPKNGWGDGVAISLDRLEEAELAPFEEILGRLGSAAVPPDELASVRLPEIVAQYTIALERDWDEHIRQNRPLP